VFKQRSRHLQHLSAFAVMSILVFVGAAHAQTAPETLRVVGYYTSWSIFAPQYDVTQIPAAQLTHLNYAFANISESGECALGDEYADTQYPYVDGSLGNMGALVSLKAANPHLRTLISIGGYTWSGRFSDVATTAEARQHFAESCVQFMLDHGFDGLDLDWEFPVGGGAAGNSERPEDGDNFILLLQALRDQLSTLRNAKGEPYLLTIAAGNDSAQLALDWSRIHPLLDWINVMTYDMHGMQDGTTGLNAPLYDDPNYPNKPSIDRTITSLLALNIPPDKLVLGVPFYGVGWSGVESTNAGLYQSFARLADGSLGLGYFDYDGVSSLPTGYLTYWNDAAQAPWLYDAATGTFISFENDASLKAKVAYTHEHHLGGVMIWDMSMDDDKHNLMNAITAVIHGSNP